MSPCPPFLSPVRVDYLAGVVLNEGINFAIKHNVKEPSPATGECNQVLCEGDGRCLISGLDNWTGLLD